MSWQSEFFWMRIQNVLHVHASSETQLNFLVDRQSRIVVRPPDWKQSITKMTNFSCSPFQLASTSSREHRKLHVRVAILDAQIIVISEYFSPDSSQICSWISRKYVMHQQM